MIGLDRRNSILDILYKEKRVVVSELASLYGVSEETIRRDLEKLDKEGLAVKTYGGAVLRENTSSELPYVKRKEKNLLEKKRIASLIGEIVKDGDNVMLDASSTVAEVAKVLKNKNGLTVITNSLQIGMELSDAAGCQVISTGGLLSESSYALVGSVTDKVICSYYADVAVVSCKALDMEIGITDIDDRHAGNKASMLHMAREKILAVDSSKFDQRAFTKIGELRDITMLVTDKRPSDEWRDYLTSLGVKCVYPGV